MNETFNCKRYSCLLPSDVQHNSKFLIKARIVGFELINHNRALSNKKKGLCLLITYRQVETNLIKFYMTTAFEHISELKGSSVFRLNEF